MAKESTVTVQVATWDEGVLGTTSIKLESDPTGDFPSDYLFDVNISKNEDTNKYTATISRAKQPD
ncbi:hypothetical protein [Grimontia sp. NTOU-MAR1]|uniref:hypothetical protein n=1 Tax=Grimontia sp. NTOU-MAR1 TaxID=3111011 RepID=UPI002DC0400B|nr:hypothetical protein [Grimontia sp. NTOU-MAR1]WRV97919.1 hypothetical protein VP504_00325 [Grimontia sp. NTOU-MAR1]